MVDSRSKPHAILVCYPLQGHVIPTINLTIKLAQKGFTITFINTQSIHYQITQKNDQDDIFSTYQGLELDIRYMTVSDGLPLNFDRSLNHDQFMSALLHVFSAHVEEALLKIMESKIDPPVNCLIADSFFVFPGKLAKKYGLLYISFWTETALVFTIYYHLHLLELNGHFGCTGSTVALILFLSPLPTFIHTWKKKSMEKFSPFPYIATFLNCGLWLLYGLPWIQPHGGILIMTINGIGLGIEIVYLTLFVLYSERKQRMKVFFIVLSEIMFIGLIAILVITLVHSHEKRSTIVGNICMVGNILMYGSPLAIMKLVIKTKSVEYMPFFLSFFSFLCSASWTTYALIRLDVYILTPNLIGTVLGLVQLLLYATMRQIAERKAQGKLDLVEKTVSGVTKNTSNEASV
ncbi:bidirectional sugar transporter SWEET4-like isoform X2 [Nicotiana sylvestris]|uniref:bidirectional sugar transporter SWEET4-like isoform X2 n=1 Tax=Nicotiana sylvestris TaxID=4096 RepID=UPI00388CD0FB